jgi:hypothetical protein
MTEVEERRHKTLAEPHRLSPPAATGAPAR